MFNKTIPRGRDGAGRGGSKKCKPIPAPPRGAGLNSHPIPAPPPLRGGENSHGSGEGRVKRGGAKLPSLLEITSVILQHHTSSLLPLKAKIYSKNRAIKI